MARRQSNAGSTAPIYEDFQPKSEQKEEQEAHVLYIHLPDFSKEQVRVIYIDSARSIRVQGERPLGTNKWSRFNRTFGVPENCSVENIHGKFQEGILTITIPKQIIEPPQPAAAPKQEGTKITPKEKEPSSALARPPPKEPSPSKVPSLGTAPPSKEPSPVAAPPPKAPSSVVAPPPKEPSPVAVPPPPPPKVPSSVAAPPSKPAAPVQLPQGETTRKGQETSPAFRTPQKPIIQPKGQEQGDTSAKATPKQSTSKEDSQTKDKEKKVDAPSKAPYDSKPQKQDETPPPFETKKKTEEHRRAESKTESFKTSDETARKGLEKKDDVAGEKGKVKMETSFMEKAREMKNVAVATIKTALEKREDRHLIVNVGVAVLVIAAVGAYVTYKIRSSAKPKD